MGGKVMKLQPLHYVKSLRTVAEACIAWRDAVAVTRDAEAAYWRAVRGEYAAWIAHVFAVLSALDAAFVESGRTPPRTGSDDCATWLDAVATIVGVSSPEAKEEYGNLVLTLSLPVLMSNDDDNRYYYFIRPASGGTWKMEED